MGTTASIDDWGALLLTTGRSRRHLPRKLSHEIGEGNSRCRSDSCVWQGPSIMMHTNTFVCCSVKLCHVQLTFLTRPHSWDFLPLWRAAPTIGESNAVENSFIAWLVSCSDCIQFRLNDVNQRGENGFLMTTPHSCPYAMYSNAFIEISALFSSAITLQFTALA